MEAGLLDVMMLHRQMEIREEETNRIEVGCEMRLPSPMDVSVAKKLQIELHQPEAEEYPEEFVSGSGDFLEDSDLFSGDSELNGKSQKNETFFGTIHFFFAFTGTDYDHDWLNIYNDTTEYSGAQPPFDSCDTTTCDDEATEGELSF